MDVWIAVKPCNAKKMITVMARFGFPKDAITASLFLEKGKILRLGLPPVRLEILTEISGVTFDDCYARRNRVAIDGVKVNLIGFEDLLQNKVASGRHKDLDDLEHLRS